MMHKLVIVAFGLALSVSQAVAGEGHSAGYQWAERKAIDDPDACYNRSGGYISNSPSFTEGCLEYLHDEDITDSNDELIDHDESDDGGDEG